MSYNKETLIQADQRGEKIKYLMFWSHQKSKDGSITASCFSQWWHCPFMVEGIEYKTAEHWMMAQKALLFGDADIFAKIIPVKTPAEAKMLGRKVKGFDEQRWLEKRSEIVVEGNLHKFSQHEELKAFLLNTKDRVLVEASPVDRIWGIGLSSDDERSQNPLLWKGLNLLGFALMEVRDLLMG